MSSESPFNNKLEFTPTLETQQLKKYWRYKMSKLRQTLIFVVAVMLLLTAVSCGKKKPTEPEDGIPNFKNWFQFVSYVQNFEWNFSLEYEIEGNEMLVLFTPSGGSDLSANDTFSLVVNDQTVPVEAFELFGDVYIIVNDYESVVLPNSESLAIKFTHNNKSIVDTSIKLPSFPSLQELSEPIDWTKPVTLNWTLTPDKNNGVQVVAADVWYDDDQDFYYEIVNSSARQHAIPANTFLANGEDYQLSIVEYNLKKYGDCIIVASAEDYTSSDGDWYSRNNKRIFDEIRKMRHQQED